MITRREPSAELQPESRKPLKCRRFRGDDDDERTLKKNKSLPRTTYFLAGVVQARPAQLFC
jgi:hypothetical protein